MRGRIRHALLLGLLAVGSSAVLAAASPARATLAQTRALASLNQQVLTDINAFRTAHGLRTLAASRKLDASSWQHSRQMALDGYFQHNSADGTVFWRRIQHYYSARGRSLWAVGENLLWASPDVSAARALQLWIASPEHLRNLLDPRWRQVGIATYHAALARGVYGGRQVTIITTDFGVRR